MATDDDEEPGEEEPSVPGHGLPDLVAQRLPPAYLAALEGIAAADDDIALAARTGVDPAAVDGLVRLALAKLLDAQVEADPPPD